jgi:alpha-galactosidase|tara:strand:+ start:24649 stop:25782 length:1134 start_codon:yes stop_codon:yes gene_type:complete
VFYLRIKVWVVGIKVMTLFNPPRLGIFRLLVAATLVTTVVGAAFSGESIKVFVLAGQSNMEGKGLPEHLVTYKNDPLIVDSYEVLRTGQDWAVRDDVWITYPSKTQGAKHGPLTVGYGTKGETSIGPEFGFGHAVGEALKSPVLIIKVAWGGKSIAVDFRPPSAGLPKQEIIDEMLAKAQRKNPKTTVEEIKARHGHYYRELLRHIEESLATYQIQFPELKGNPFELAGFAWHQGFNDKVNSRMKASQYDEYTILLIDFIKDIRKDLGAPALPFVIGELSTGGIPSRGDFQQAQKNATKLQEFEGNVAFVLTAEYYDTDAQKLYEEQYWKGTDEQKALWRTVGNDRPYHYLGSGKTYYLKGKAFAEAIIKMIGEETH